MLVKTKFYESTSEFELWAIGLVIKHVSNH